MARFEQRLPYAYAHDVGRHDIRVMVCTYVRLKCRGIVAGGFGAAGFGAKDAKGDPKPQMLNTGFGAPHLGNQ